MNNLQVVITIPHKQSCQQFTNVFSEVFMRFFSLFAKDTSEKLAKFGTRQECSLNSRTGFYLFIKMATQ